MAFLCCYWRLVSIFMAAALFLFPAATAAGGQAVDVVQWHSGLVTLSGGWLQQGGDNPAWAQPAFDDSEWEKIDLDDLGAASIGWTWYRLHVKLAPGHEPVHLLIGGGDGTYELYLNGAKAAGEGIEPSWRMSRPTEQVFVLNDEYKDLVIAIRTHITRTYTIWHLPTFLTADIGTPGAIENKRAAMEAVRLYGAIPSIAINFLVVLAGLGAFALFRSQRDHREYMWLGLYLLSFGLSDGLLYASNSGLVPLAWNNNFADPLIYVYTIMQIEFTFSFADKRIGRVWRGYECLLVAGLLLNPVVNAGGISSDLYVLIEAAIILPVALLLPVMLFLWKRKGNREVGWLILPSLLPAASTAAFSAGSASIFTGWGKLDFLANPIAVGPVSLQLSDVSGLLFVLAIGVVMFLRFTRVSREQTRVAAELEAAREIQQRLVPARLPQVKGYVIEAAYFPAQEVGGDFYQVFEQDDGAQLVVVGDVSGKGLKAAMTGTLALGALRTLANEGLGPAAVLMRMNQQLAGAQDGGFITCVCAQLRANGEVTIANAGHLPPYRNGEELPVATDLPLGISLREKYEERVFQLEPGDRLTLLSDGVLEARDAHGMLFGFERTRAISSQAAGSIAQAARDHGQEDDITVLTLALSPAAAAHA